MYLYQKIEYIFISQNRLNPLQRTTNKSLNSLNYLK